MTTCQSTRKHSPPYPVANNDTGTADGFRQAGGLTFRLPSSVSIKEEPDGLFLVLDYPLKFIRLNTCWQPVFSCLSGGDHVPLSKLIPLAPRIDPLAIELLLAKLVRRGFLEQQGIPRQAAYPSVTIVIPVRNRPTEIRKCLTSLMNLNYPSEKIEIIVVDDCSTDTTPDVIREFPVKLLTMKHHRQASFCRNMAAKHAGNDILAFIDSDCEADPDWLLALTPAFQEDRVSAVGGKIDSYYTTSLLDRYEKVQSSLMVSSGYKRSGEVDHFFYVPSCNFLIRRGRLLQLDGFKIDQHVGEDVDLCWRVQNSGFHVDYRPTGAVYHKHRNRLLPFCTRRFDYGTSEPQLHKLHENRRKKMVLPPLIILFWLVIAGSILTGKPFLLFPALAAPFCSFLWACKKIPDEHRLAVSGGKIMWAVLRSYCAWLYHLCFFVSRYYLLVGLALLPVVPSASLVVITMHGIASLGHYVIKKPRLPFPVFFFFFSLEQISYQSGVWWGSFSNRYFGSIFPRATFVNDTPLAR